MNWLQEYVSNSHFLAVAGAIVGALCGELLPTIWEEGFFSRTWRTVLLSICGQLIWATSIGSLWFGLAGLVVGTSAVVFLPKDSSEPIWSALFHFILGWFVALFGAILFWTLPVFWNSFSSALLAFIVVGVSNVALILTMSVPVGLAINVTASIGRSILRLFGFGG